jgi:leucyl aminopeptidase
LGATLTIDAAPSPPDSATAVGIPVAPAGTIPAELRTDRAALETAGFDGKIGSSVGIPADGRLWVAVGIGDPNDLDTAKLRDAAAAFARAAKTHERLAFVLGEGWRLPAAACAQSVVEGAMLARYSYDPLRRAPKGRPVRALTVIAPRGQEESARSGAERGRVFVSAAMLARDLASTPHSHLSATRMAEVAVQLGAEQGFDVEVFDKEALVAMGCGGLLAVNAGSVEPPCMIKLTYRPPGEPSGRLALVGKGIMYDSGGISLKPSDMVHAKMKNDMTGAAAILAAVAALGELGATTMVTGFLMCTDNMPSGSATALGDVITIRGGTTVEIIDTDAEGRLVMSDALVLATEEPNDAVVDIATLTGSVSRALGPDVAGLFGTDQGLVDQVKAAAAATDEPVWQLPLHRPYRSILDSNVADLVNCGPIGKPDGIVAALYLAEFVGDLAWAHIDIAGTAWNDTDTSWRTEGASGFGARLLIELASGFVPPSR